MRSKRAISLLSTFTKREWSMCDKYMRYRYKDDSEVYGLWNYFKKRKHKINELHLDEKDIADKMGIESKTKKIQNLLSSLTKTLDQYAVQSYLQENPLDYDFLRISVYQKRGLHEFSDKIIDQRITELSSSHEKTLFQDGFLHRLHHMRYFSNVKEKFKNRAQLLSQCIHKFILHANNILSFYKLEATNYSLIFNTDFSKEHTLINKSINDNLIGSIALTSNMLSSLISDGHISDYRVLQKKLVENKLGVGFEMKATTYILLHKYINDTIRSTNNIDLLKEVFELSQVADEQNLLVVQNKISRARFMTTTNVASTMGEFTWLEYFIEKYAPYLDQEIRQEVLSFVNAEVFFRKGEYDDAIALLSQIQFNGINETNTLKGLLLLCYYEKYKSEPEIFINHSLTLKKWIKYNESKLSTSKIQGALNLIKLTQKLITNKSPEILLKTYRSMDFVQRRIWIISKLKERGCFDQ